jgi:hypothetical protein
MIFRNKDGKLEELKLYEFKNDFTYYSKVKSIKNTQNVLNVVDIESGDLPRSMSILLSRIEETTKY